MNWFKRKKEAQICQEQIKLRNYDSLSKEVSELRKKNKELTDELFIKGKSKYELHTGQDVSFLKFDHPTYINTDNSNSYIRIVCFLTGETVFTTNSNAIVIKKK